MSIYNLNWSTFSIRRIINIIISIILIFSVFFVFFQALIMNIKHDKPLWEQSGLIAFLGVLSGVIILLFFTMKFTADYYKSKYQKKTFSPNNNLESLKKIREKLIIGLWYTRKQLSESISDNQICLQSPNSPQTLFDYFSLENKIEFQEMVKGKTTIVLIEIAYQDPSATNPTKLSKSLNIPLSSLSREISKLIKLNYLEPHISKRILEDTRLKNFKISLKGYQFLSNLNSALNVTIDRLKERKIIKS